MATIYTIKGTDSISSSRLNINDNFNVINTELGEVHGLFTISSQDLGLTGTLTIAGNSTLSGNVSVGGTLDATGVTTVVDLVNDGRVRYSILSGTTTALPTAGNWTKSIYQFTLTANAVQALYNGEQGQEVFITAVGGSYTLTLNEVSSNLNSATSIVLTAGDDTKESVLLRFIGTTWHIVSIGSGATVS